MFIKKKEIIVQYYFNSVNDKTGHGNNDRESYNVSRKTTVGQEPHNIDRMSHDDAVADIRERLLDGYSIIIF